MADDALLANKMNFKDGGLQRRMRDTSYRGIPQIMVNERGETKGLRTVRYLKQILIMLRIRILAGCG